MDQTTSQTTTPVTPSFSSDPAQILRRHIHDGVETERIDYDNLKNTPAQATNSAVSAFRGSTTQTIGTGGPVQVQYDNEVFDLNNEFDTSTYAFQPKQDGYYLIYAQVEWATAPSGSGRNRSIKIYKNNSIYQNRKGQQDTYNSATPAQSITDIIHLNGGSDNIKIYVEQDEGSGVNINNDTSYFVAALLFKT